MYACHLLSLSPQAHPFFDGVSWERLPHQRPPYVPRVEHALDTQNFERFDEEAGPPGGSGSKRWARADPNFIGYTYKNWEAVGSPAGAQAQNQSRVTLRVLFQNPPWAREEVAGPPSNSGSKS